MKVSLAAWNKILGIVATQWPKRFWLDERPYFTPDHPWSFSVGWNEVGKFGIRIKPGFVNGSPAYVRIPYRQASKKSQDRIQVEYRELGLPLPSDDTVVDVYLIEDPLIPLFWRSVDPENPNETLPPILSAQGNNDARILATEIIISSVRSYTTVTVDYTQTDFGIVADLNVGYRIIDSPGYELQSRPNFEPAAYEFSGADVFFNRYAEPPAQEVKLLTLYAIRPKDDKSTDPQPTWKFGAEYDVHYNLAHVENVLPPTQAFRPLTFISPLGVGLLAAPGLLAANNQASADALAFVSARRTSGFYYAV